MRRILSMLLLAATWTSPAVASVYTLPGLTIYTGGGGQPVTIVATIATLTMQAGGGFTVEPETVTLELPHFTGLFAKMDWSSGCEFEPGCVISAPSEIDVTNFSGILQFTGGNTLLNGTPLPWDLSPWQTISLSGPLSFTASVYTDSQNLIALSAVPEPATWALFTIGVLGLGFAVRRRGV